MIASPARVADRVVGASGPPPRALSASTALVLLLLGGLVLRLTIAYILFPASGFATDISTYVSWAMTMAEHGPGGFYANAGFSDYPPGYLLVLWPVGVLANAFGGGDPYGLATTLIKLPPMLLDIAVGYVLYRLVLGWAWPGRRAEGLALGAAALYVFNPVTWYDSALWGQTDAAGALVVLLGVAALVRGNSEGAAFLGVLAALVKPQFGVVLIPLVAVLLLRRHLLRPGSGPRRAPWGPAALRGWLAREQGWRRLVTSALVALVTFHVLALPFGLDITGYLELMGSTAGGYEFLTVNAYNLWALVGVGGQPGLAWAMPFWLADTSPLIGAIPAVAIGAALLVAGFLYGLANLLLRDERRVIIVTATFLGICFFLLPTRVHERYLVPVFALIPLLAVTSRAWLVALVALSVGGLINLHGVLTNTNPVYGTAGLAGLPLGEASRSPTFVVSAVLLATAVFAFIAWRLWAGGRREPDRFAVAATRMEGTVDLGPVPENVRSVQWSRSASGSPPRGADVVEADGVEADGVGYVRGPSALDWIIDRITSRSLRRDRSASLRGEPGGRLDRLDLLLALCILLSAVTIRGYRLAEPYDMYFDEVYHARTAMEFLQDWRYGEPHSIYEYTHPHLAKYAMALGIEAFGDHRVTGESRLDGPVLGAAIEPRWSDSGTGDTRVGDRLYVLTGSQLQVLDLADRGVVATLPTTATALTLDTDAHRLFLAGADGVVSTLDTTGLDRLRTTGGTDATLEPIAGRGTSGRPVELAVAGDVLVIRDADGTVEARDTESGDVLATTVLDDAAGVVSVPDAGVVSVPDASMVVATPADITDVPAVARVLAEDMDLDRATLTDQLRSGDAQVVISGWPDSVTANKVRGHISDGTLEGVSVDDRPVVAVSTGSGVAFLDAASLTTLTDMAMDAGATGMAWAGDAPDGAKLYVASGSELRSIAIPTDGPQLKNTVDMPGPISAVLWNAPPQLVHAVGSLPDGRPTIYVVDPHGNSVFEDAPLPFTPVTAVADTQPDRPSEDRTQIVALAADGVVATVDIGGNAWGYRLPGVLMGAATAASLYLLARLLFRRRSVGLFAAALALAEGMLFANSRIAMNDVYVTGFLVMAATLFVPIWMGTWRRRWQVILLLPTIGLLLGLALASKWVAAYAIGGFLLLLLLRSGLGRIIALAGMVGLTAVLGALAIRPADVPDPHRNWPFLLIMMLLTASLAAAVVRRPLRMTRSEVGSAVVWLVSAGAVSLGLWIVIGGTLPDTGLITARRLLLLAGGSFVGAAAVGIGALLAGRLGRGPFVPRQDGFLEQPAVSDGPGWVSAGTLLGIPWLLAIACLTVVPIVVYVISYAPWVALGNQFWTGFPAGHTGQTLLDLTISMYRYHDDLRATHAASSPWWAWPLDLKPVWYYQQSFAGQTAGSIHDAGNLVIFWMGIPAVLFASIAAWRRHSLALTVVVIMFLVMWLPWSRIDRATFQYHYYTSVPFIVLALAYLLAELWQGPARVAWLIARVGAVLAILGAPLLWLFRQPLCIAADTQTVNAGSEACGTVSRQVSLSDQSLAVLGALFVGGGVLMWQLARTSRRRRSAGRDGQERVPRGRVSSALAAVADEPMSGVVVTIGATLLAIIAIIAVVSDQHLVDVPVGANELAVLALLVLAGPAWLVLRARDPRRFALGVVIAAALWLLIWYPNLTGLPLPSGLVNVYQGLLPTWNYAFQFATDLDPPVKGGIVDTATLVIAAAALLAAVAVMLVARRWRSHPPAQELADLV